MQLLLPEKKKVTRLQRGFSRAAVKRFTRAASLSKRRKAQNSHEHGNKCSCIPEFCLILLHRRPGLDPWREAGTVRTTSPTGGCRCTPPRDGTRALARACVPSCGQCISHILLALRVSGFAFHSGCSRARSSAMCMRGGF